MTVHDRPEITAELPPGWQVPGYTHHRVLGTGATGQVRLAVHDATGTPVAIKYLSPELGGDPQWRAGFRAEAALLAEVDDPHVARFYEYVEAPAGAAIVMELVDGVSLREVLRQHGPTDPEAALLVLKGSLLGLSAAHERGVVHRDYKPENVLVLPTGESKLADFGIASRIGAQVDLSGTPGYMAPEQWRGEAPTPASDIYAATATFYECLTGRQPYAGPADLTELQQLHEYAEVPTQDAPPEVQGLLRHGMAKRAELRPSSASEFLELLESVATAAYGADWEENGRGKLIRRIALLLALLPSALAPEIWPAATSALGKGFRASRTLVMAGTAALVVALSAVGVGLVSGGSGGLPIAAPTNSSSTTPSASMSPTPGTGGSATPGQSPSSTSSPSLTASPSGSPSASPTSPAPNPFPVNIYAIKFDSVPAGNWKGGLPQLCSPRYLEVPFTITAAGNGQVAAHLVYAAADGFRLNRVVLLAAKSDGQVIQYSAVDEVPASLFSTLKPRQSIKIQLTTVPKSDLIIGEATMHCGLTF